MHIRACSSHTFLKVCVSVHRDFEVTTCERDACLNHGTWHILAISPGKNLLLCRKTFVHIIYLHAIRVIFKDSAVAFAPCLCGSMAQHAASLGSNRWSCEELSKGAAVCAEMAGLELALDPAMLSREALLLAIQDQRVIPETCS